MSTRVDRAITFDERGLCSHCNRYDRLRPDRVVSGERGEAMRARVLDGIRRAGAGREYDCLIGVSGGVDSTYVAYLVKKQGLRPLAVHLDNGWNSELSVANIEKTLKRLDVDLFTYVLDWPEFRDLQLAFWKASTPDGEIPTDHAIFALLWSEAVNRGIKYIISGMNFATEAMSIPSWSYGHSDWRYIRAVHRRFGTVKLRRYPHFSLFRLGWINAVRGVRTVSILNYGDYQRAEAMKQLQEELGWVYYGGKHYESVYTRFWQGYVLPRKFGIDKRYGHCSDLINAGQMTREEARQFLKEDPYPASLAEEDRRYVIKKLGLTEAEFEDLMAKPVRSFRDYPNSFAMVESLKRAVTSLRGRGWYSR